MKNLYVLEKKVSEFKAKCIQIYLNWYVAFVLNFELKLFNDDNYLYLDINLFRLLELYINWTRRGDHFGFQVDINLFGLNLNFDRYDVRHWDYDKDEPCKY